MVLTQCDIPRLRKIGNGWELTVDGKPFLILGGELQNSAMSSSRYMDTVWQNLLDMGINTILGPVTWEDIEPVEDQFDFTELDAIISGALAHGIHLIVLWFGAFKNGMSSYTPSWIKTNPSRFPRMRIRNASGGLDVTGVISIFHDQCIQADAKAFARLMEHLKATDLKRTVIMVQVQNEVGLLGDSRDRSTFSNELFSSPVPQHLVEFIHKSWNSLLPDLKRNFPNINTRGHADVPGIPGSWEEFFGEGIYTDEIFMAYHYALYVEKVGIAGKREYDIPIFTNVWLPKPGQSNAGDGVVSGGGKPGEYPSGGAVSTVLDIWQKFAPSMAFIAPDIYAADYSEVCRTYSHGGQALFIPEQHRHEGGCRRIWEAIGHHRALGASPFGVDTLDAKSATLAKHYKLLKSVAPHILEARAMRSEMTGFFFDDLGPHDTNDSQSVTRRLGNYELRISREFVFGRSGPGFGIIINSEPNHFLLIGMGFKVEFKATSPTSIFTGILRFKEKSVADEQGTLRTERLLNGDETRSGKWANMPNENPDHGGLIPITIPARTMIAEVVVYSLEEMEL